MKPLQVISRPISIGIMLEQPCPLPPACPLTRQSSTNRWPLLTTTLVGHNLHVYRVHRPTIHRPHVRRAVFPMGAPSPMRGWSSATFLRLMRTQPFVTGTRYRCSICISCPRVSRYRNVIKISISNGFVSFCDKLDADTFRWTTTWSVNSVSSAKGTVTNWTIWGSLISASASLYPTFSFCKTRLTLGAKPVDHPSVSCS
ncbi:uncharacterized protein F4812DRAFT_212155 [Daldinia caldariorum]|uniref:uncharacterized protein n=1 Tax=Daldinia caldariorum TaxID=326644 RepID=UPI002007A48E|nr:uncharacterized protein F4812DRAFT_212155 [Daldinia caldariorum]KAI1464443.1 hypothetical protein F4812DRAFT_212155 [Daldinia caldariorum]